jgi:heme-degrading monooxygenase HmoA
VIERHVTFHLHPGKAEDLVAFFRTDYGPAMARQKGFLGAELLQPPEADNQLVLVLKFEDAKAAQVWRESADHKALSPRLKSFYQRSDVRVHQVLVQQPAPERSP